jgi:hypothetical protein
LTITGAPYTGGSATTNFPQLYVNDGTGPTTFSAAGTEIGSNAPSGFTGNVFDAHINGGASVAKIDYLGNFTGNSFTASGSTAGYLQIGQGSTNSTGTTNITIQAPASVTSYLETLPGTAAQGIKVGTISGTTITEGFSGDSNHSATVSWSTATSVGSTSLCSTTNCPVGTYRVSGYIDVTTACTTTGSYVVNLIYTDDTTASKTVVVPFQGLGFTTTFGPTAVTSTLVPVSTTDYGSIVPFTIRSTGAASINYSTTAAACGTGGPGVGKLYLIVEPIQ